MGALTAPPYRNEGPRALWHVSEDPAIERFVPRDGRVWAIDTRHLPLYWYPRDCPRRVHVVEPAWLTRMRAARVYAYRMPEDTFELEDRSWISQATVEPLELVELGDLLALHAEAEIELRIAPGLLALWDVVVSSTLDFSGIRLRNAAAA